MDDDALATILRDNFSDVKVGTKDRKEAARLLSVRGVDAASAYLTERMALTRLMREHFPGLRFEKNVLSQAGKRLKSSGPEATLEFLQGKGKVEHEDFGPPAKMSIVAQSRPFEEWPIVKVSQAIQAHVYGATREEMSDFSLVKGRSPGNTRPTLLAWLAETGIEPLGTHIQGLNKIFSNAEQTYWGVEKKVENRNKKGLKKHEKKTERQRADGEAVDGPFEEESAFGEDGRLKQPPGINPSIFGYQGVTPKPLDPSNLGPVVLPEAYAGYSLAPDAVIPVMVPDRLAIPKGEPGYVPEHQRPGYVPPPGRDPAPTVNVHKKRIRRYPKVSPVRHGVKHYNENPDAQADGAILAVLHIKGDWVVFDLRAAMRSLRFRRLVEKGVELTPEKILSYFRGDPVIDSKRGLVVLTHTPLVVSRKIITGKRTKEVLMEVTKERPVALLSIDLGEKNPVAARITQATQLDGELHRRFRNSRLLPEDLQADWAAYREGHNEFEARMHKEAEASLSPEHQAEYEAWRTHSATSTKKRVCLKYGLQEDQIPWDEMGGYTFHIAKAYLEAGGDPSLVQFTFMHKKGKRKGETETRLRHDRSLARDFKPKVSKEARDAHNKALWDLKRDNPQYHRLSQRKTELSRRTVNFFLKEARMHTRAQEVVVILEDLNVNNRMMSGSGKWAPGWDGYFQHRGEGRWFIQVLHKAFSDLAPNRGVRVMEVNPSRTSQTCPQCRHCDRKNRSQTDRNDFRCLKCGYLGHSDLDVATFNIEKVAVKGEALPRPDCEGSSGAPIPATSRKSSQAASG